MLLRKDLLRRSSIHNKHLDLVIKVPEEVKEIYEILGNFREGVQSFENLYIIALTTKLELAE